MSLIPAILYLNETAGNGTSRRLRDELVRHMRSMDWKITVLDDSDRQQGLQHLGELLPDTRIVLVAGGDGTLNGVVATVMEKGIDTLLGIVPAGTGNDFARAIGLDSSARRSAARLFHGHRIKSVDVGKVSWRTDTDNGASYFLNVCGMGLDAEIALNSTRYSGLGRASYLAAAFEALLSSPSQHGRISVDGQTIIDGRFHLASVANGKYAGGGFVLVPDASPADGVFDLGVVVPGSKLELLKLLRQTRREGKGESNSLLTSRGESIVIETNEPAAVHIDGEVVSKMAHRLEVSVMAGSLRMIVPTPSVI